jgi:hypothetical protein
VKFLSLIRCLFCDRDFDDGLLQKIPQIAYEDDIKDIPPAPDVSNYLVSEVTVCLCTSLHMLLF